MKQINYLNAILFLFLLIDVGAVAQEMNTNERVGIMPGPQIEAYGLETISLSTNRDFLTLSTSNLDQQHSIPFQKAVEFLSKRLMYLGQVNLKVSNSAKNSQILADQCSEQELHAIFKSKGIDQAIDRKRLSQAYYLKVEKAKGQNPIISVKACNDLGIYYAFVTLCQLVDGDEKGKLIIPEVEIADWPELGLRLAKASASDNKLPVLNRFYQWMALYKINMVGLQFHGEESRELGPFRDNINAICPEQEKLGLVETIVYYCPFRGNGYNFKLSSDKEKYAEIINWVFDQGAHGFEIDYNDWPDEQFGLPAEEVVTFAYNKIMERKPNAYVLYCPPNRGPATYNKAASRELIRILSGIPESVWPIWTGMKTLLNYELTQENITEWTEATGRRPFFWLNRVSIGVDKSLSKPLEGDSSKLVLPGELLPKDLNRYFHGIHLNYPFAEQLRYGSQKGHQFPIPDDVRTEELIYFATVADYIWNPQNWKPERSYKRAQRFVSIMEPLMDMR